MINIIFFEICYLSEIVGDVCNCPINIVAKMKKNRLIISILWKELLRDLAHKTIEIFSKSPWLLTSNVETGTDLPKWTILSRNTQQTLWFGLLVILTYRATKPRTLRQEKVLRVASLGQNTLSIFHPFMSNISGLLS